MTTVYQRGGKRLLDAVLALTLLVLFSPILLIVGGLVAIFLGRPILFSQLRPGRDGRLIRVYKFRTMTSQTDANGELLPDAERLTRFGKFLRSSSLDELPELWNILVGEMSFVGPRPLLPEYLKYYTETERRRHDVAPGLTGWAQVNGRNALSWDEKFRFDVWYVDHVSLWLDIRIVFMTVKEVFSRKGISASGHATMPHLAEERAPRIPEKKAA